MRILQLGRFYPPSFGGIQNVIYEITTGLNCSGVHCDVLCSNDKNLYEVSKYDGYQVLRTRSYGTYFSTSITLQMISKLNEIKNNYDIISVHFPDPMAVVALLMTRPKAKIVIHWHSDVIKQKYLLKLFEPFQNWIIGKANLVIGATINHIEGSDQRDKMVFKSNIIPYPFDTNYLLNCVNSELLKELKEKYNGKKIVFGMGRLVYYKGFEHLIDAAKYLSDDYMILIGGQGVLKEKLKEQIRSNNLEGKVELLGAIPQNDLGTYYEICDVFCLPSTYRSEMYGIVQLEAMSFGKPVVSTKLKRSGVSNVNIDNVTGMCVKVADSSEIGNAIKLITNEPERYKKYSINAKNRVSDVFEKSIIIKKLIDTYSELLACNK
jgi:glycosyltransferase involved in cell wall biosynthesis